MSDIYCSVCDEPIEDERCYVIDPDYPDDTCICKNYMKEQLMIMSKSGMNKWLYSLIDDWLTDGIGLSKVPERRWK